MPKEELKVLRDRMEKVIEHPKGEFLAIRTGRAHPGLVSDIKVDYYGAPTPIKQIATISVPEGRQIAISPFDRSALKLVEKAILASSLGVTPQNDGEIIRVNLPELTAADFAMPAAPRRDEGSQSCAWPCPRSRTCGRRPCAGTRFSLIARTSAGGHFLPWRGCSSAGPGREPIAAQIRTTPRA